MSAWEKFTEDFRKSISAFSEKTAELVKEGAEKTAATVTYTTKVTQLNLEKSRIEKRMQETWTDLGRLFYGMYSEDKLNDFKDTSQENLMPHLTALAKELEDLEHKKQALQKSPGEASIDKTNIRALTSELETHGGTISQITISEDASVVGKKLREINLPKEALIGTIVRGEQVIIPDGNTAFAEDDKITLIGKIEDVEKAISQISKP